MPNKKCLHCNRAMVAIGDKRANGGMTNEWETRKYHKNVSRKLDKLKSIKD